MNILIRELLPKLMKGSGSPVLGKIPVATAILAKDWNATRVAIPTHRSLPDRSLALAGILRHSYTISKNRVITTTRPINPNYSPITAKMKSVCSSERKLTFFTEAIVVLNNPLPFNWPEPMAMMELFC